MNAEQFQDAMNYLDDDLIEETDELRQGKRVLYRRDRIRQVLQWVAPAACLVLVLGLASRWGGATSDSAFFNDMIMEQEAGEAPQDGANGSQYEHAYTESWEAVTAGTVSIRIPDDWEWALEPGEDDSLMICFRPKGCEGVVKVGYMPNFGVCGTGLETEDRVIAGMRASVGTYDGNKLWSFITFPDAAHWYVVLNEGAGEWWSDYGGTAMQILETIVITEQEG